VVSAIGLGWYGHEGKLRPPADKAEMIFDIDPVTREAMGFNSGRTTSARSASISEAAERRSDRPLLSAPGDETVRSRTSRQTISSHFRQSLFHQGKNGGGFVTLLSNAGVCFFQKRFNASSPVTILVINIASDRRDAPRAVHLRTIPIQHVTHSIVANGDLLSVTYGLATWLYQ